MSRISETVRTGSPDFAIVLIGIMSLSMGVWLLTPLGTFSSSNYGLLANTAPEWFWGALMVIPGVLKIGGTLWRRWRWARVGVWWAFVVWLFFSASFFMNDMASPISILLFWKAIFNGWFVLYLGQLIQREEREE